jgi:FkbH-like protein
MLYWGRVTLNQALAICRNRAKADRSKVHFLACGCQPLHLATLLEAHLFEASADDQVGITTGLYGDLTGSLELAATAACVGTFLVMEWSDLDPRLGLRSSGGWSPASVADMLATCQERCSRMAGLIERIAARMPVAVVPPSLPRSPIGTTIRAQSSEVELALEHHVAAFLLQVSKMQGVRVLSRTAQAALTPESPKLDAKMELIAGFPYTIAYADALAAAMVALLHQKTPKKGLITDMDDTFWSGIVGEVGVDGVSWDQEHHTQTHGLYQQMLGHLAEMGVLIGVASKNEQSVVEAGLARKDLLVKGEALFPVHANWGPKSRSVAEILKVWNIDQTAVVFIDDSPMELSEVQTAFPGITCIPFKGKDAAGVWELLGKLRDLFGKPQVGAEDLLRRASLQAAVQMREAGDSGSSPEFLRGLGGTVTIDYRKDPADKRPVELVNKTNQYNLNGLRIGEGEWLRMLELPETVLSVISYQDKFGPLGKIAVAVGTKGDRNVHVSHWVMSCRAFSRRIEHHTLESLFEVWDADEISFDYQPTAKNQPLQDFLSDLGLPAEEAGRLSIGRADFIAKRGELPHSVSQTSE